MKRLLKELSLMISRWWVQHKARSFKNDPDLIASIHRVLNFVLGYMVYCDLMTIYANSSLVSFMNYQGIPCISVPVLCFDKYKKKRIEQDIECAVKQCLEKHFMSSDTLCVWEEPLDDIGNPVLKVLYWENEDEKERFLTMERIKQRDILLSHKDSAELIRMLMK